MKKNYTIVLLILITFFVISFLTNILGALNPSVSNSFNLSEGMAGFLPFTFFIAYGVMSIPSGFLVEKYGEKKLMLLAFLLAFIAPVLFISFPSFGMYLFTLFTIGSGMAILQVVINPLLRVTGGEENYAFTSVLGQLVFGAASFVSPQVYSWLVTNINGTKNSNWFIEIISKYIPINMSWTSIYWIFAIISLLMIFILLTIAFPKVELKQDEKVGTKKNYINLFKNKLVVLYFFGIFAYVGAEQGISYWMSKFLNVYHNFDYETIGANAIGNFWGLMTVGGVFGLILLKIMDSKIVLKIFTSLSIVCFGFAVLSSNANVSLYAFQLCGLFLSVMYPIIMSLALNSVSEYHGAFTGILMTGIVGGAVVQLFIGFLSDFTSLKTGMLFVFITLVYILSIGFWAKPIVKNKIINLKQNK
ncbi:MFS transporter [Flavivirga spongiicola]|uniref:MFS transporter n=1 Tax=Flavivirga spongiicola TaxID=421621 RepID=A0ABU7XLD1_9FLAO|nr:MFS transporter [Flavivirga sp. MEBiC05379]MDO5981220.1 MFS transporter [Flavivirga sp. MEBiC05379]